MGFKWFVPGLLDGATPDEKRGVWLAIAQMNIRLRRWKDAEDALDQAEPLATKKDDRTYLFFLRGEWAERQKRTEQGEQFFRQALNLDPENAMTLNYQATGRAQNDSQGRQP